MFPAPMLLKAEAAPIETVELFSFLPFSKAAYTLVNLGGRWRLKAVEVQSFLEQSKAAAQIRQRMDFPGRAQFFKDARVSFLLCSLHKTFQRASHFFATHPGILVIRPDIITSIFSGHFRKAFSDGCFNIRKSGDLTPA